MAIPSNPITTKEEYLRAIALGNTTLPDHPITREEQYLEVIAGKMAQMAQALPEANGTYSLKCTVSNGTVTYRWQS